MNLFGRFKNIPGKVVIRYLLLNIPGVALLVAILFLVRSRIHLPGWFIALVTGIWVIKDVVLFPLVWRSYDWDNPGISVDMVGLTGIVKEPLSPVGRVQIKGELWKAEIIGSDREDIERGARVRVVERSGLVLYVIAETGDTENEISKEY